MSVTFQDRAQVLIDRNIPFTPLKPKSKVAFIDEWQRNAFVSLEDAQNHPAPIKSECNIGAIAQAKIGGKCFFETDSPDVIERIKSETGRSISPDDTFGILSSPGKWHFYFNQTARSIAAGNIAQGFVRHGDWSLRVDDQYVVGPLSIHEKTGLPYTVVSDAQIIDIPDWLVDWCLSQRVQDSKNKQETIRDENNLIPHGQIHGFMHKLASELRGKGLTPEEIEPILLRKVHQECQPPIDDDKVRAMAHSVGNYPEGKLTDGAVLVGNQVAGTPKGITTDSADAAAIEAKLDRSDAAVRPDFPYWALKGTTIYDGFVEPVIKTSSKHTEFLMMAAVQVMLNYLSGKVRIAYHNTNLNLFLGFISPYGQFFKSSSCKLAHEYFKLAGLAAPYTPSRKNADGLVMTIQAGSPEGFGISMSRISGRNAILFNDELSKFVSKASIENSSFASDLLSFYESDDVGNNVTNKKNAYAFEGGTYCFSWLWCTTDRGFNRHWPKLAGISSGMVDRMFFVISPKKPKPAGMFQTPNFQDAALGTRKAIDTAITQGVYDYEDRSEVQSVVAGLDPRSIGLVEKLSLYFAIDLKLPTIDGDCVERAKALVDYRNKASAFLAPIEAETRQGRLQKEILRELRQQGGAMKKRDLCRNLSYGDYGTEFWSSGYIGLTRDGQILEWKEKTPAGRTMVMVGLVDLDKNE